MRTLRVATYNIHKGVRGLGPARRLEIHNLALAVGQFDADLVCLQEVRRHNRREEEYFTQWPAVGQADWLAPEGYEAVYRTNAYTRHGEHGNALLSRWPVLTHRHEDISDHRLEQRGLLHAEVRVEGAVVHVIVLHLGLIRGSRLRQVAQVGRYVARSVPEGAPLLVAGDFNEWGGQLHREFSALGLETLEPREHPTFPARLPLVQLDGIYVRGLRPLRVEVPHGRTWWRMSDHLPLIMDLGLPA